MQLPVNGQGHKCKCQQDVPELDIQGVAIWSEQPTISGKLAESFERIEGTPAYRTRPGADWLEQIRASVMTLSPLELGSVRGAVISADGRFDPWQASPIDTLLDRIETPWFPGVLNSGGLKPHMQPIARTSDGSIFAFEALARAEVGGELKNGGQLVDAARAHHALFQFDQIGRTTAIRSCGPKLIGDEKLFVNFIPMVIYDPTICLRTCWQAADEAGVPLSKLVFEVIESEQFPDMEHLRRILTTYREKGAGVALDDLGTGYTALSYIDELHPDYIKLAKDLIPLEPRREDLSMVRGIVEHAKRAGITVLAEGIETEAQLQAARDLGIDLVQGWLIGRPAAEPVRTGLQQRRAA